MGRTTRDTREERVLRNELENVTRDERKAWQKGIHMVMKRGACHVASAPAMSVLFAPSL